MDKINALFLRQSPGAACLESQKQCSQTKCIACGINGGNAELLDPKKEESNLIWPFFPYDPSLVWHHIKGARGKNEKWCHLNFFANIWCEKFSSTLLYLPFWYCWHVLDSCVAFGPQAGNLSGTPAYVGMLWELVNRVECSQIILLSWKTV